MNGNNTVKNKQARDAENPQWRKEIGVRIGKVREECGMSQGELADRLGVNRVTMTYWENGTRDIKTTDIVRLADALGVSCDYLLRGVSSDNLSINAELGLSEKAIEILRALNTYKQNTMKLLELSQKKRNGCYEIEVISKLIENAEHTSVLDDLCNIADLNPKEAKAKDVGNYRSWMSGLYSYPFFSGAVRYIHDNGGMVLSASEHATYVKETSLKRVSEFIEAALLHGKAETEEREAFYTSLLSQEEYITPYYYEYVPTTPDEIIMFDNEIKSNRAQFWEDNRNNEEYISLKQELERMEEETRIKYADNIETK